MPCISDYMNPTESEKRAKELAGFMMHVHNTLFTIPPEDVAKAAEDCYGKPLSGEKATVMLCELISGLSKKELKAVVYDAHNKTARKLADWWEEHLEKDKQRRAKEGSPYDRPIELTPEILESLKGRLHFVVNTMTSGIKDTGEGYLEINAAVLLDKKICGVVNLSGSEGLRLTHALGIDLKVKP